MLVTAKEKQLIDALEPTAEKHGVEIVTVEVAGGSKAPRITVYIDTPTGVGFDELSEAQPWINQIVEDIDPFPGAYILDVTSPGIDRPLRTPEHFSRFAGETVQVACHEAVDGRKKFTGTLVGCADGVVTLAVDGADVPLDFGNLKRAHVKGAIDFTR
ncbi:ribosome maturation factor RimP [Curtanaerobium respiraculi]|uniref:ribosome maturation factor RimP n=1 Tax=Curtanaerobium respiraculi TaxID=2949669 RepID=UPI003204A48D